MPIINFTFKNTYFGRKFEAIPTIDEILTKIKERVDKVDDICLYYLIGNHKYIISDNEDIAILFERFDKKDLIIHIYEKNNNINPNNCIIL